MYILNNKTNNTYSIYREKTKIASLIGITSKTLAKHLNNIGIYENENYKVIEPYTIDIKSNKGGMPFSYRKPKSS